MTAIVIISAVVLAGLMGASTDRYYRKLAEEKKPLARKLMWVTLGVCIVAYLGVTLGVKYLIA